MRVYQPRPHHQGWSSECSKCEGSGAPKCIPLKDAAAHGGQGELKGPHSGPLLIGSKQDWL